jgi:hypothetical protein
VNKHWIIEIFENLRYLTGVFLCIIDR